MDQVNFLEDSLQKISMEIVLIGQYPLKFFKGCLPQNLFRPLLNILSDFL